MKYLEEGLLCMKKAIHLDLFLETCHSKQEQAREEKLGLFVLYQFFSPNIGLAPTNFLHFNTCGTCQLMN